MSRYFYAGKRLLDAYGGYQTRRKTEFESSTTTLPALPGPANEAGPVEFGAERIRPSRPPSLESDVLVPAGWAGVIGLLTFGITVYVAMFYGYQWHLGCVAAMAIMAAVFAIGIIGLQKTLWMVEKITHIDLDGDDEIGPPGSVELYTSVRDDQDRVRKQYIMDTGVPPEKLVTFCKSVLGGRGLTVSAWVGKNNLFSRSEFDRLMAELERAQMIERDGSGSNAPRKLTQAGREAFQQLAQEQF